MGDETKRLSAEDILGASDLEIIEVPVPEWKGSVFLRVLPADEGLVLGEALEALPKGKTTDALFMLLGACLVDADGVKLFANAEDAKRLKNRSQKVLLRLQRKALELQGWIGGDAAKNV